MTKKRYTQNIISTIILSIVALLTLAFCIYLLLRNAALERAEENARAQVEELSSYDHVTPEETEELLRQAEAKARAETQDTILGSIREGLTGGDTLATTVRRLFPNELLVATTDNRYAFYDIDRSLPLHGFEETDFVYDADGRLVLQDADTVTEHLAGIDISQYQEEIDWERVAADGIRFAFIRIGTRRSRDGVIIPDELFSQNVTDAAAAGVQVGAYFYSSALNVEEAREEAEFMINALEPYREQITWPVALDIEPPETGESRHFGLEKEKATENALLICEMLENEGYQPLLYGNMRTFTQFIDQEAIGDIPVWIAYYNVPQYYPYRFAVWQYTNHGIVDGIDGEVDLNLCVQGF